MHEYQKMPEEEVREVSAPRLVVRVVLLLIAFVLLATALGVPMFNVEFSSYEKKMLEELGVESEPFGITMSDPFQLKCKKILNMMFGVLCPTVAATALVGAPLVLHVVALFSRDVAGSRCVQLYTITSLAFASVAVAVAWIVLFFAYYGPVCVGYSDNTLASSNVSLGAAGGLIPAALPFAVAAVFVNPVVAKAPSTQSPAHGATDAPQSPTDASAAAPAESSSDRSPAHPAATWVPMKEEVAMPRLVLRVALLVVALAMALVALAGVPAYVRQGRYMQVERYAVVDMPITKDCDYYGDGEENEGLQYAALICAILAVVLLFIATVVHLVLLCARGLAGSGVIMCTYCVLGCGAVTLAMSVLMLLALHFVPFCEGQLQISASVVFFAMACVNVITTLFVYPLEPQGPATAAATPPLAHGSESMPVNANNPLAASQPLSNVSPTAAPASEESRPAPSPLAKMSV